MHWALLEAMKDAGMVGKGSLHLKGLQSHAGHSGENINWSFGARVGWRATLQMEQTASAKAQGR